MQPEKTGFFKDTKLLAEEYISERLLLLKLETAQKSARLASIIVASLVISIFAFIILLLVSALACYLLQVATGSWLYGFGIVILFYVLILTLVVVFRKSFFYKSVANFVIRVFFEKNANDESEN